MRSWTGQRPWRKWVGTLALSEGEDFQRKSLPFLRLFWPSAQLTPTTSSWRTKGADILAKNEEDRLDCAVRCLGFGVQEIGENQIREAEESVRRFLESDVPAHKYIFIHNRDGRFREFNQRMKERLNALVSRGKVTEASLWDRQTFLNRAFDRMQEILGATLRKRSDYLLCHFQGLFKFSGSHVAEVPVAEKRLIFRRNEPCVSEEVHALRAEDISRTLLATDSRWTLLTGSFGTGKTTASLHAARSSNRPVIFVPCAMLSPVPIRTSTNALFEEATRVLGILDEFEGEDREVIHQVAGAVLSYLLRHPESPYTLILDGLDENRVYGRLEGLQHLSNQLGEVSGPVVLTTRSEHLHSMLGHFNTAFQELSTKWGNRPARLLELGRWEKAQVVYRVEQAMEQSLGEERARLANFLDLLQNEAYADLYRDLPFYPLFLQFILEDVAERGVRAADRCQLLRSWVERKIRRDRAAWVPGTVTQRATLDEALDTEAFIGKMMILLENTAYGMTRKKTKRTHELVEFADAEFLEGEAKKLFTVSSDPVLPILLNSVLVAPSGRRAARLRVAFALRVLQEYFLASYLLRNGHLTSGYPESVRSFYFDLKSLPSEVTGHKRRVRPTTGKNRDVAKRLSRNKSLLKKAGVPERQREEIFWRDRSEWPEGALLKVHALEAEAARKSRERRHLRNRDKN